VRDGIALAKRGIPALAFVTDDFWPQGDFVATAAGMPGIPRLRLPHPVAGTGKAAMTALAARITEEVIVRLGKS
jgi:hypothetical protein